MSATIAKVEYVCDWTKEDGQVCGAVDSFAGSKHGEAAREAGWGWYANAYVRRIKWGLGAQLWFCPVHATQFRNNHGWGDLEAYGPPKRWWESFYDTLRRKP